MIKPEKNNIRVCKLYQTVDVVAQTVTGPLIRAQHDAAAIRIFTDGLKDPNTLGAHADDYELRVVGIQDEETGEIQPYEEIVTLITGAQWRLLEEQKEARKQQRGAPVN